ncbi:MAG: pre-peptidase C-terminal domain-containing protein [Victivallaceae bacterium]|jgi:hypothetical protein
MNLKNLQLNGMELLDPNGDYSGEQVIYLDFNGENNVSYDNAALNITVNGINVADSGLDQARINRVITELNNTFAGTGVSFTTEVTENSEYSTIYIGDAEDAFSEYGNFLGLSETIDVGNQIHNDNAFVFSVKINSITELTAIIAHETAHLQGVKHSISADGKEINDYAVSYTPISSKSPEIGYITGGESDYYSFSLAAESTIQLVTSATSSGNPQLSDTILSLFDSNMNLIASNDDYNGYYSYISRTLGAGDYIVKVAPYSSSYTGEYMLTSTGITGETITIGGIAQWRDSTGAFHPIAGAKIEIREKDAIFDDVFATITTALDGSYSKTINLDSLGDGYGGAELYVRVYAESDIAQVGPNSSSAYYMDSAVFSELSAGSLSINIDTPLGDTSDNFTAFSILSALNMSGQYISYLAGSAPVTIPVVFGGDGTYYAPSAGIVGEIHLIQNDRWDWDVVQHEYGHYVQNTYDLDKSPGGEHKRSDNLSVKYGTDAGIRLAWGEGWATFFALAGQDHFNISSLGIPLVGNGTTYDDTEDQSLHYNVNLSNGSGEDNELSVSTALWNVYTSGVLSEEEMFQILDLNLPETIGDAWKTFSSSVTTEEKFQLGYAFELADIAPSPFQSINTSVQGTLEDGPLTFAWDGAGAGNAYDLEDFSIQFYSDDFSQLILSRDVGDIFSYKPSEADWNTILATGEDVKWVVGGKSPASDTVYWSGARTISVDPEEPISIIFVIDDTGSMSEEISGVRSALQRYIQIVQNKLGPEDTPPMMQLITFKDDVTTRLTTNDLAAMSDSISGLYASGGGDCPEYSNHALARAVENIGENGIILFATDASPQPGVNMTAVLAQARSKGVRIDTILSGDCSGIDTTSKTTTGSPDTTGMSKPGSEYGEPDQVDIHIPVQAPIDDHGNSSASATELMVNSFAQKGVVDVSWDVYDWFKVELEAGTTYSIKFDTEEDQTAYLKLLDQGGVELSNCWDNNTISFTPTVSGTHFLAVEDYNDGAAYYSLSVSDDPIGNMNSAVEMFSTLSSMTGGVFLVRDDVNSGNTAAYESAIYNVMASSLGPTVISCGPNEIPRGTAIGLTLTGRDTNWRDGYTSVAFSGENINILSIDVHSATSLTVSVQIANDCTIGFYDVTVSTSTGEIAVGDDVVEIGWETTVPTLLSVESSNLSRGKSQTVTIRGVNTAWDSTSVVDMGDGITVNSITVLSAFEIEAKVTTCNCTNIGFRTVSVTTDGEGIQSMQRAVFISAGSVDIPEITLITPTQILSGQTADITITGKNITFIEGQTDVSFRNDSIDVKSVTVINADTLIAQVQAGNDAVDGFYDIYVTVNGVVATKQDCFEIIGADITAPTTPAALTGIVTGSSAALDWAEATDEGSGVKQYEFQVDNNSDFSSNEKSGTAVASNADTTGLADGTYYWRVRTQDNAGNYSEWSTVSNFMVDATAPAVPAALTQIAAGNSAALDWADATDSGSGVKQYEVQLDKHIDFSTPEYSVSPAASAANLGGLTDGTFYWRVRTQDNAGNYSTWAIGSSFISDLPGNINGALLFSAPSTTGWVGLGDPADYYKLTLGGAGKLSLTLTGLSGDANLTLYDGKGKQLKTSSKKGHADENIADLLLYGGDYYVKVAPADSGKSAANNTPYTLNKTLIYFPDATDNNTYQKAAALALDDTGSGSDAGWVGFGDATNYYQFTTTKAGSFDFALGGGAGASAKLTLYSLSKGKLAQFKSVTMKKDGTAGIDDVLLTAGTWYAAVDSADKGKGIANTDYALNVSGSYFPGDTVGNTQSGAAVIGELADKVVVELPGWVGFGDPADYYQLTLANNGKLNLNLTGLSGDANLTLLDNKGKVLKTSANKKFDSEAISTALLAGDYFVKVAPADGGKGIINNTHYTLSNMVDYYPEDKLDNVPSGASYIGGLADKVAVELQGWVGFGDPADYYQLTLAGAGALNLSLTGLSGDANLTLLDNKGKVLKTSANRKNADEAISTALLAGDYFVKVAPADGGKGTVSNTPYTLSNYFLEETAGSSFATAVELTSDGTVHGWVGSGNKEDYYKFEVLADGATATGGLSGFDSNVNLYIYDSKHKQVASSTQPGLNPESIDSGAGNMDAGIYYVKVMLAGTAATEYDLNFNLNQSISRQIIGAAGPLTGSADTSGGDPLKKNNGLLAS